MKQSLLSESWINESTVTIEAGVMKESLFSGPGLKKRILPK